MVCACASASQPSLLGEKVEGTSAASPGEVSAVGNGSAAEDFLCSPWLACTQP